MKKLVIVESPTKARTISRFLGNEYDIRFSMGHVMDLPKSKLGVDLDNNFTPQYEVVGDKKKLIAELKAAAKGAVAVILATDPDREGEAISANIQELLEGNGKGQIPREKFSRVVFHEITEDAIKAAFTHSRQVDTNLVNAQTARRVLDRLVGYQLSPLLWKKVRRGLSAGRVQSVALRLIVEREREIEKFSKSDYWTIHAHLKKESNNATLNTAEMDELAVLFDLIEIDGKRIELQQKFDLYDGEYKITKTSIDAVLTAEQMVSLLEKATFRVATILQKETKRTPQAPFITSTLQQEASRRFGFAGKRTMSLAQKLYEEGFITYHRTDSVIVSESAIAAMRSYIEKTYGARYVPAKYRSFTTKQKTAQEAHEAIRPTKFTTSSATVEGAVGRDYAKLYDLIWRRTVASQMADALVESTTVYVDGKVSTEKQLGTVYRFKANGTVLIFDGFLKVNPTGLQDTRLPKFIEQEQLKPVSVTNQKHETAPPPRYNDASIIATLEEKGIGRPSTYASIISTIDDRGYIERVEKRFEPTAVGIAVNDFLVKNFSSIDDIPFTAQMEDTLDNIANGKSDWISMMREFYTPFKQKLGEVEGSERIKIAVEQTSEICPLCKEGNLVVRTGKFGKFLSCSRFPDCKFTKPFVEETDIVCPKDGGKVIMKKTRKGRKFFGCSNYPTCDFAAWKVEDIKDGTWNRPRPNASAQKEEKTQPILTDAKKRNLVKKVVRKTGKKQVLPPRSVVKSV